MAIYGYTKNYKLIKPQFNTDTWHDYIYDNLDTIDAIMSAIYASGNWQGFWQKNTHYDVGDVVIDKDTDTMYKVLVEHTTSENTFALEQAAHPTYYELWSPNNLAESWAIDMDGLVSSVDYSSKAYAISSALIDNGSAKEWAIKTDDFVGTTGEYSAKKHATDAASSASTAASQASAASASATLSSQWAVSPTLVASTDYSSKSWATGSLDAGSAKDWAIKEGGQVGTTGKYSAKVYSLAAENHYEKARDWASKTNGQVESTDYSAKAYAISEGLIYAGSAKEWSDKAKAWATSSTIVEDGKYGSSYYALQAYNANVSAQAAKTTAQEWASKTDAQVASTDYSSKAYAQSEGLISSGSSKEWATKSATWAEGSDADVSVLGGTHSSKTWADNSEIWAEGTDEQVQALGGTHSAKVWSEQSTNANVDLSNLSATGENHFANPALTNSSYTTNRILEIPQDIKLELNNGTLTLKAGSKVYVPNGFEADGTTPKFDVLYVDTDKEPVFTSNLEQRSLFYLSEDYSVYNHCYMTSPVCSGGTDTLLGTPYHVWFDTLNNVIRVSDDGTTYLSVTASLPLSVCTVNGTQTVSIDQVFNGRGYIGSTVFALPGVRGLNGEGRQTDGTFLTKIREVQSVLTTTVTTDSNRLVCAFLYPVGEDEYGLSVANEWELRFSYEENCMYFGSTKFFGLKVAEFYYETTNKLSLFSPVSVDSVANSNASNFSQAGRSYLSGLASPSSKFESWTLGASGASYIAPANGYVVIRKISGVANAYLLLRTSAQLCNGGAIGTGTATQISASVKVSKGDTVYVDYSATGTTQLFGFVYDNGEN